MSQFFSVHPKTPQKRLLEQAVYMIQQGALIVYPTDSGYALGCSIHNKQALERMCKLRKLSKKHNFTLACSNLSMMSTYAYLDNAAFKRMKAHTPNPYTFILKARQDVPNRLVNSSKKNIGVRIPNHTVTLALLETLGEPITTTSLILPDEQEAACDPYSIREELEHQVDLIIDSGYCSNTQTTMLDLTQAPYELLREGAGNPDLFLL